MYNKWVNGFRLHDVTDGFVTPAKKAVPYTITVIGDKNDLKKWKAEQEILLAARAVAHANAYALRREIAVKMVEEQNTDTLGLSDTEKAEMALRPHGKTVYKAPSSPAIDFTPGEQAPTPTTLKQTLLGVVKRVWMSAFDSSNK